MINLLIDARSLSNNPKGVGRYSYEICTNLVTELPDDWKIDILVHEKNLKLFPKNFKANFIFYPLTSEIRAGFLIIPKLIKKLNSNLLLRLNEGVGSIFSIPYVTICHDINELILKVQSEKRSLYRKTVDKIKNYCIKRSLQNSDFVLCNSKYIQKESIKYYQLNTNKVKLAYCGVDERFYHISKQVNMAEVKKKLNLKNYILTFATGDSRENFYILPNIIKILVDQNLNIPFVIAGINKNKDYFYNFKKMFLANDLIEGKHYIFVEFMGIDKFINLVELYSAADFYLELSLHEGFGMQLVEAMACGTTCITSTKGALKEVADCYGIIINNPYDVQLIADIIKISYENNMYVKNNQQVNYTKKFSWKETVNTTKNCLLELANRYYINA